MIAGLCLEVLNVHGNALRLFGDIAFGLQEQWRWYGWYGFLSDFREPSFCGPCGSCFIVKTPDFKSSADMIGEVNVISKVFMLQNNHMIITIISGLQFYCYAASYMWLWTIPNDCNKRKVVITRERCFIEKRGNKKGVNMKVVGKRWCRIIRSNKRERKCF